MAMLCRGRNFNKFRYKTSKIRSLYSFQGGRNILKGYFYEYIYMGKATQYCFTRVVCAPLTRLMRVGIVNRNKNISCCSVRMHRRLKELCIFPLDVGKYAHITVQQPEQSEPMEEGCVGH